MKKLILAFTALFLVLASGCKNTGKVATGTSSAPATATQTSSSLDGTWQQTCTPDAKGAYSASVTFANGHSIMTVRYFKETMTCTTAYRTSVIEANIMTSPSTTVSGANNFDVQATHFTWTPATAAAATAMTNASFCGIVTWAANVTIEFPVGSTPCGSPAAFYDLYKIDGNSLYFGDTTTGDTLSPGTRPTKLEATPLWFR